MRTKPRTIRLLDVVADEMARAFHELPAADRQRMAALVRSGDETAIRCARIVAMAGERPALS